MEIVTETRQRRRCRSWAWGVLALLLAGMAPPATGQQGDPLPLAEQVRMVLLGTVHKGDPPKAAQLTGLAVRAGVPPEQVYALLIGLAGEPVAGRDPAEEGPVLARRAIEALGNLRVTASAGLLERIAAKEESLRATAIRARVRIGGEGLAPFAQTVLGRQDLYPSMDRYALYEELSPYVGVDAVRPVLLDTPGTRGGETPDRPAVVALLVRAVATDGDLGNVVRLDQVLCLADGVYRRSDLREARLQEIARSRAAVHQAYAAEQLTQLRALPAAERTHVEAEVPVVPGP